MCAVDEDDETDDDGIVPRPFRWMSLVGIAGTFGSNVFRSVAAACEDVATVATRHTAYQWDRDMAFDRMHAELEALPTTE